MGRFFLALMGIAAAVFLYSELPQPVVFAESSRVLAEAQSGTVLFSDNGTEKYPCGSMSKLMTVLIAAEKMQSGELSEEDIFTVSEHANSMQGAQIWLMPGDKISVEELLKGIIIGNANDAACALAEGISGTEEDFVLLMNSRAAQLGMTDTLYINASGYKSVGDRTTAEDTARLLCELSKHKQLAEIFTTRMEYIRDDTVQLVTSDPDGIRYSGSVGFKSGFWEDEDGGRTYYSAEGACRDGDIFVSAVLGEDDEDISSEKALALLDTGFAAYETVLPEAPSDMPRTVKVRNGRLGEIRIEAQTPPKAVVSVGTSDEITCRTAVPDYVYAPVKRGDKIGEILYYYDDEHIFSADITAVRSCEEKTFKYNVVKMLKNIVKL
ncbi:MAG: serine hydrolase [Oscillospiraceae bacterium]|nr:serine hydrolase [Oscillospiraceae bacterium]